jgi:hypothetical protein
MLKRAVEEAHEGNFSIFHLSCHGDEHGLGLTDGTTIDWSEFANLMSPFADETRMLVLASCFAGVPGVSRAFRKEGVVFGWIFGSRKGVGHTHSCLAWSVLYYSRLAEGSRKRAQMKLTLDKINAAVRGDFMYRRWDQVKYVRYASARKAEHRSGDRS